MKTARNDVEARLVPYFLYVYIHVPAEQIITALYIILKTLHITPAAVNVSQFADIDH